MAVYKNWRFLLLAVFIIISLLILGFKGISFGIDFEGGTLFTVEFSEKINDPEQKTRIANTISQRLDWTGLRDTTVTFFGDEFVLVQLAETDPEAVDRIEYLLRKQGRFESTIDGNLIFTGDDILPLSRDPTRGYGFRKEGELIRWHLPFTLKTHAAERFRDLTFHQCQLISYDPTAGREYDCEKTFFFIDRPLNSVLIIPTEVFSADREMLLAGNIEQGIQPDLKMEEVLLNANTPYIKADANFSSEQLAELEELKQSTAVVPSTLNPALLEQLEQLGFEIKTIEFEEGIAWTWQALGVRDAIALSPEIAHMDVATKEQAEILSDLQITGIATDLETAQERLSDLDILLSSGSLPVSVKSISKESISPLLGANFLMTVIWMGLLAIIVVALVVFLRYRVLSLTLPLIFMIFCETLITIALASMVSKFDLGAVAGIIAAVGTGIDTEIIIMDELLKGEISDEIASLITRVRRAFFIIFAAAAVSLATMLPIIFFGFGLGKLVGFAITTTIGVLVGILITRPAFAEIARKVIERRQMKKT